MPFDASTGPQAVDLSPDPREEPPRDRDLGKLEGDISTMADDLGADLDQLHARRGILMTTERTKAEGRLRLMPQQIVVYPSVTGKSVYGTVPWWM